MIIDRTVTQGDTLPILEYVLDDANGVIDLTGATVTLRVRSILGGPWKVNAQVVIVLAVAGSISYQWLDADCDTPGLFYFEFRVVFADGRRITVPNSQKLLLEVVASPA